MVFNLINQNMKSTEKNIDLIEASVNNNYYECQLPPPIGIGEANKINSPT